MKHISTTIKELTGNKPETKAKPKPYILLPVMTPADFRQTFINYENHLLEYNSKIDKKNTFVNSYNKKYQPELLTEKEIQDAGKLHQKIKNLSVSDYNYNVEKINKTYGKHILKMRRHLKIRYNTQRVFAEIVKHQARSLNNRNRNLAGIGASTRIEKNQPVDLYLWRSKVANELGISKKTVYNNIQRLIKAGVIIGYKFRGAEYAFKLQINPKILVISDGINRLKDVNIQNVKNQRFTHSNGKELPHNIILKQESLKKNKENDNAHSITQKGKINNFNKTHNPTGLNKNNDLNTVSKSLPAVSQESNTGGGLTKFEKISKRLKTNILHYYIFAIQLATGLFNAYKPMRNDILKAEILYGTLTREEFRQVLIQELIKISAKIWKDWKNGVFAGQWIKLIKLFNQTMFITNNGHLPHKETMFQIFLMHKWRLKAAINYKNMQPDWIPQAPLNYFNPALKTTGYAKTGIFYRKNAKQQEKIKQTIAKLKTDAYSIEFKKAVYRKIEYRIDKVNKGKMTLNELVNWCKYNTNLTEKEIINFINYKNKPNE